MKTIDTTILLNLKFKRDASLFFKLYASLFRAINSKLQALGTARQDYITVI